VPPEGVAPIPQAQYDRIRELWPELGFKPYAERTENTQCSTSSGASTVRTRLALTLALATSAACDLAYRRSWWSTAPASRSSCAT
jgi:hypothetical protein